uniref:Transmembrane protein 151B n=1 Tax=Timema tahoe TaxID=61484 RepID=A0A7R9IMH8_9NEOP|nr:unnamed protein product [Timema tahoe]
MINILQLLINKRVLQQEQRPIQQSLCRTLQREASWKCLILTLLIYGCLGAVTWCRMAEVTKVSIVRSSVRPSLCSPICPPVIINFSLYPIKSTRQMSPCDDGYIYIPVAFMAMLYLVYLVECWHCTARIELSYRVDINSVIERVRQMREALPIVWWKAVCYHYVRRKRQVTRYRNGDSYTTTQVYYERVNSHASGSCFVFAYCGVKDVSRDLTLDARGPITKIRFSKGFAFSNIDAAAEFEEQRSRFFSEHERYDDYMEMREGLDLSNIPCFKEYVVAYSDPDRLPWYSSQGVFWLFSFCLLSWPLRMIIEYNTAYLHYQVTKLFGVNYDADAALSPTPDAPHESRGQLSHDSTIDSCELELDIRDNSSLVPSYSESLLMAATGQEQQGPTIQADSNVNIPVVPRIPLTHSSFNIRAAATAAVALNRRSWGGIFTSGSRSSLCRDARPQRRTSYHGHRLVFLPSPLVEHCPDDPFQGRSVTTPTEDPPPYEDALRLPALGRLRRSLTDRGDICRRGSTCIFSSAVVSEVDRIRVQPRSGRALITMETSL